MSDVATASRVTVLGSGNAFHQDGRGSAAIWLKTVGGASAMVDLGPTAVAAAARHHCQLAEVDVLFLTHLHGDHTAGWPFLFLQLAIAAERTRPLEVVGPIGTQACLEGLLELCYAELVERARFETRFRELPVVPGDGVLEAAGILVDTVPMEHHPTSLGYRLHLGDATLGVSGDTAWCPAVGKLARGCDVLLLECTSVEPQGVAHVSLAELRRHRAELSVPLTVLVHLNDAVAADLARDPLPGTLAAYDGWTLNPGAGTG